MSQLAIIDADAFEDIKKVSDLYAKGVTSPFTIARRLGKTVVEVRGLLNVWHEIVQNDAESKDLARDALHTMLQRYDLLLQEANENLDNLKNLVYDEKVSAQINTTIKVIGDLDKTRVDLLQKAGILDNHELGDELAERERREAIILNILRNDLCPICTDVVRESLTKITGHVEGTVVEEDLDE